jgi:hypothetical protein
VAQFVLNVFLELLGLPLPSELLGFLVVFVVSDAWKLRPTYGFVCGYHRFAFVFKSNSLSALNVVCDLSAIPPLLICRAGP